MKLKFFIAGVAIVAGLASAVSCQDLTKDLTDLKSKVASLESTVQSLQAKIDAGSVITSVTPTNSGIVITLSNGNKYEITNGVNGKDGSNGKDGKDGKDGSVVTIGENGNWFIDGTDTGLAAKGQDGKDGKNGTPGAFYVPNSETGCFDLYTWDAEKGEYVVTPTEISFLAPGTVTAVWDDETGTLTLFNVEGGEGELGIVVINGKATIASISLVEAFSGYDLSGNRTQGHDLGFSANEIVGNFVTAIEKTNTFGPNKEMVFVDGTQVNRTVKFVVRVSPANAVLDPDDICFTNSMGIVFDQVEVVSVEPYEGILVKSYTETGLYVVEVALKEYDEDAFEEATYLGAPYNRSIAFAMKAGDAISTYDISFTHADYVPESGLDLVVSPNYWWNGTPVDNINNRYKGTYTALTGTNPNPSLPYGGSPAYTEKEWKASTPANPTPAVKGTDKNAQTAAGDDRHAFDMYNVVLNEPFFVYPYDLVSAAAPYGLDIKGIYVSLDMESNAVESAPSEWNAWNSYEIAGLDYVYEDGYAMLTITDERADGDIIGFRVYAVNWDGTLVDPDGRAFYVQVGTPGVVWDGANTVMQAGLDYIKMTSNTVNVTTTPAAYAATYNFTFTPAANSEGLYFDVVLQKGTGTKVLLPAYMTVGIPYNGALGKLDQAQTWKVYTIPHVDDGTGAMVTGTAYRQEMYQYKDGKTYAGTIKVTNADGFTLATMPVYFTKILPTDFPAGFSVKTAQVKDGIYNCYLLPEAAFGDLAESWVSNTANYGYMAMTNVFNFPSYDGYTATVPLGTDTHSLAELFEITFDKSQKVSGADKPVTVDGTESLEVAKSYIDNSTQKATTVEFNYGTISSEAIAYNAAGYPIGYEDITVSVESFKTVYNCIYNSTYSWSWDWTNKGNKATARIGYNAVRDLSAENTLGMPALDPAPATGADPFKADATLQIIYQDFNNGKIPQDFIFGKSAWDSNYNEWLYQGGFGPGSLAIQSAALITDGKSIAEYYNVTADATYLTFTEISGATNPTADVPSTLVIKCKDQYNHDYSVKVPVIVKKR